MIKTKTKIKDVTSKNGKKDEAVERTKEENKIAVREVEEER